jgi:glycosyltransferase involved in cell wall biosynthesis
MKILLVYPYFPHPRCAHGTAVKIFNYLKNMSKNNEVTLCCLANGDEKELISEIKPYCKRIIVRELKLKPLWIRFMTAIFSLRPRIVDNYFSRELLDEMNSLLLTERFDVMQFEISYTGEYLNHLENTGNAATILFEDDEITFLLALRKAKKNWFNIKGLVSSLDYLKLRRYQIRIWRKFDKILTINDANKRKIESLIPGAIVVVVPNGVDTSFYRPLEPARPKDNTLIYIANYWHYPNEDAVLFFINKIYKLVKKQIKDIRFIVVGKNATERMKKLAAQDKSIELLGFVEDPRVYMNKAKVYVVPMRLGHGIRLKVVEAMAMGIPMVSTSVGLEGIPFRNEVHAICADTPESFAEAIVSIFNDSTLASRLSVESRNLAENIYDWRLIHNNLEDIYASLVR